MKSAWIGTAMALVLFAIPASAEDGKVKAGVDAWASGDYVGAVAQWRGPADAGDADAEFNLAQAYKLGRGVPADLDQAEQWYHKAAVQGHPQAQDNYGLALFQNGKRAEAVQWLQRSAQRGEPRAQFVLATMYFNGDAVTKDWVRAYALMMRASSSGLSQATQTLAQMDRYIPQADRDAGRTLATRYAAEEKTPPPPPVQIASTAPVPVTVAASQPAAAPTPGTIIHTELPPSAAYHAPAPAPIVTPTPAPAPAPVLVAERPASRPAPVQLASRMPSTAPERAPMATTTASIRDGGWKLQLGAFGDPGNARKLWNQIAGRFPGREPLFVKAGSLTKVLVGPYGSGGEANLACRAVKPCIPVGP